MSTVGYSGTPLFKKLGLKEGARYRFVNAPPEFASWLEPLPLGCRIAGEGEPIDVVVLFAVERESLSPQIEELIPSIHARGGLWIAWPKRASKVPTDITEDVLRGEVLPLGWVDNKVCAISETWSGLRFVRRLPR